MGRVGFKTHESNPISSGLTHSGQPNPSANPLGQPKMPYSVKKKKEKKEKKEGTFKWAGPNAATHQAFKVSVMLKTWIHQV